MTLSAFTGALPFLVPLNTLPASADAHDITGCYSGDLLSDVLAHARAGNVLVTVQAHSNTVVVAKEKGCPAIIFCNGRQPQSQVIAMAGTYGIHLFSTEKTPFAVSAAIASIGLQD